MDDFANAQIEFVVCRIDPSDLQGFTFFFSPLSIPSVPNSFEKSFFYPAGRYGYLFSLGLPHPEGVYFFFFFPLISSPRTGVLTILISHGLRRSAVYFTFPN